MAAVIALTESGNYEMGEELVRLKLAKGEAEGREQQQRRHPACQMRRR